MCTFRPKALIMEDFLVHDSTMLMDDPAVLVFSGLALLDNVEQRGGPQRVFCAANMSTADDMLTFGVDLGKVHNAMEQQLDLPGVAPWAFTPKAKRGGPQRVFCEAVKSPTDGKQDSLCTAVGQPIVGHMAELSHLEQHKVKVFFDDQLHDGVVEQCEPIPALPPEPAHGCKRGVGSFSRALSCMAVAMI